MRTFALVILLTIIGCKPKSSDPSNTRTTTGIQATSNAGPSGGACLSLANAIPTPPMVDPKDLKLAGLDKFDAPIGGYKAALITMTPAESSPVPDTYWYQVCDPTCHDPITVAGGLDYNATLHGGNVVITGRACVFDRRASAKDAARRVPLPSGSVLWCGDALTIRTTHDANAGQDKLRGLFEQKAGIDQQLSTLTQQSYDLIIAGKGNDRNNVMGTARDALKAINPDLYRTFVMTHMVSQSEASAPSSSAGLALVDGCAAPAPVKPAGEGIPPGNSASDPNPLFSLPGLTPPPTDIPDAGDALSGNEPQTTENGSGTKVESGTDSNMSANTSNRRDAPSEGLRAGYISLYTIGALLGVAGITLSIVGLSWNHYAETREFYEPQYDAMRNPLAERQGWFSSAFRQAGATDLFYEAYRDAVIDHEKFDTGSRLFFDNKGKPLPVAEADKIVAEYKEFYDIGLDLYDKTTGDLSATEVKKRLEKLQGEYAEANKEYYKASSAKKAAIKEKLDRMVRQHAALHELPAHLDEFTARYEPIFDARRELYDGSKAAYPDRAHFEEVKIAANTLGREAVHANSRTVPIEFIGEFPPGELRQIQEHLFDRGGTLKTSEVLHQERMNILEKEGAPTAKDLEKYNAIDLYRDFFHDPRSPGFAITNFDDFKSIVEPSKPAGPPSTKPKVIIGFYEGRLVGVTQNIPARPKTKVTELGAKFKQPSKISGLVTTGVLMTVIGVLSSFAALGIQNSGAAALVDQADPLKAKADLLYTLLKQRTALDQQIAQAMIRGN